MLRACLLSLALISFCSFAFAASEKIYFSSSETQIAENLKSYAETLDLSTEEGQIDYLLSRLETSPDIFERNGTRYTAREAAEFLRWKMNRPRWQGKVNSVRDFVDVICAGSVTSGKPYTIILPDKRKIDLKKILDNELEELDQFLLHSVPPQS